MSITTENLSKTTKLAANLEKQIEKAREIAKEVNELGVLEVVILYDVKPATYQAPVINAESEKK